jgi:nucleoside-diphosphate-sugar epimerase
MVKKALVCGAGGFIGSHLVKRLKDEGYWVRGVDLKNPEFSNTKADDFKVLDLRNEKNCITALTTNNLEDKFDEVYQLAADMGGAGFVFTGEHDLDIMHNSATINLNFVNNSNEYKKIFYSSSACVYPEHAQLDPDNTGLPEDSAYPADPDSEYGWEKLFSERMYLAMNRNKGVPVRIQGGREKAPAAMARKVAIAKLNGEKDIEIWGDGKQTRSFLYIDECLTGIRKLMESDFLGPINIGSEERISINNLAKMASQIADYDINLTHIKSDALGVRGRNSDNKLILEKLGWQPDYSLRKGMEKTYSWIEQEVKKAYSSNK